MHLDSQQSAKVIPLHRHEEWHWDSGSLEGLLQDLASVDHVTEHSFLELGDRINAFHDEAHAISRSAGEVLQLLHGGDGESTLQQLQLLVERCSLWLSETQQTSVDICTLLNGVVHQIKALEIPVAGLRKVIKTLHSLRVSTRIEAAKGYASGAGVLAKSLDELGGLVQEKISEIFDRTERLIPLINKSLETEETAQLNTIKIAVSEVEKARYLLTEFMANQIETGQWTDQLKERSDEVKRNFGEIVAALQFQDITRQRLEHVRKTLDSLGRHLERFEQRTDFSNDREAAGLFGCICQLQHDQLALAGQEFLGAADNLTENLQGMALNVEMMSGDTKTLLKSTDACSVNRFSSVLNVLQSIADCLQKTQKTHQEAGSILTEVNQGVQQIADLVEEVEFIGEEMQLLAMNAAISAAHARKKGAGLDIIAQNIQLVAEEATKHALKLAEECGMVTEQARQLEGIERDTQSGIGGIDILLQDARQHMTALENSTHQLQEIAGRIDRDAASLCDDVAVVVMRVDLKTSFQQKLTPALEQLAALGEHSHEAISASENGNLEQLFVELELCYTMASERHIHERFMEKQDASESIKNSEQNEWTATRDHDLGDNVDLF
jgi:methyl-accepting chemotaxis protein